MAQPGAPLAINVDILHGISETSSQYFCASIVGLYCTEIYSHVETAFRIFKLTMYLSFNYQSQHEGLQKEDFPLPCPMFKKNLDSSPTTGNTRPQTALGPNST